MERKLVQAIEERVIDHSSCRLSNAIYLIAGEQIPVRRWSAQETSHTYLEGLLRIGMSLGTLLWKGHGGITAVSGPALAYRTGHVDYFSDKLVRRSLRFIAKRQPLLIVSGSTPTAKISEICGCDASPKPDLQFSSHCLVLVFANWKGLPAVFHFGRCNEAIAEIQRGARGLEIAASDPRVSGLVPRSLARISPEAGGAVSVEDRMPGFAAQFAWNRVDAVLELWCGTEPSTGRIARHNLSDDLDRTCEFLAQYSFRLQDIKEKLLRWHDDRRFQGEISHGDFWLGNVLFAGERVSGILDWEWARLDGIRLVDAIHLLLMSFAESRNVPVSGFLQQVWHDSVEDRELSSRLNAVQSRYGMEKEDIKFLALLLWFDYLGQRVLRGRMPRTAWTQSMISQSIPVIDAWLSRH